MVMRSWAWAWACTRALAFGLALAVGVGSSAFAQTYPNRPIRVIAPFPAGGLVDVLARAVGRGAREGARPAGHRREPAGRGRQYRRRRGRQGGAGWLHAADDLARHPASMNLAIGRPFDRGKAFTPISLVADMSMLVVVHPKVGVKSLSELIEYARANPGKLDFGSAGVGTAGHLGQALLTRVAKIKVTHVPSARCRRPRHRRRDRAGWSRRGGHIGQRLGRHHRIDRRRGEAGKQASRRSCCPMFEPPPRRGLPRLGGVLVVGVVAPAGTPPEIIKRSACGDREGRAPALHATLRRPNPAPAWSASSPRRVATLIVDGAEEGRDGDDAGSILAGLR